jgi:hypothetical protein
MVETILEERLNHIFEWYRGMVSEKTGRLVYVYDPEANTSVLDGSLTLDSPRAEIPFALTSLSTSYDVKRSKSDEGVKDPCRIIGIIHTAVVGSDQF